MVELRIPLKAVVLDFEKDIDLLSLTDEQAVLELAQAYAFLGKPVSISIDHDEVVVVAEVGKPQLAREAARSFERANDAGQRGHYDRAVLLYQQVLEISPDSVDARRNLAMAYLEMRQLDKAKQHLLEALRLDPQDAWSNLLAGNILAKYDRKLEAAMKWYHRAYETNPQDPILLTNIGAMLKEQGQTADAINYFTRAIAADSRYPNARYALALTRLEENEPEAALDQIEALFSTAESIDTRSNPLRGEARKLYVRANEKLVEQNQAALQQAVQARQGEIAELTSYKVVIQEDPFLKFVTGMTQMAWRYHRDYHLVKYHVKSPLIVPHILFHELQHIEMVDAARKAGRNRYFATSETS